jgi:(p)ppGpp synthase/HD superfamily hydrolase
MAAPNKPARGSPADSWVHPINLATASRLAEIAHRGQVDKAGNPYVEHVFAVRDALASAGLRAQIAGVLHDVVEDTPTTLDDLRRLGAPEDVVRAVDSVTRRPDETYMDLVRRAAADPIGRVVKLADNRHNSDEARLALLPGDQAERLRRKYAQAREVLEGAS